MEQYKLDSIVKREPQAIPLDEVINGIAFNEYTKDFLITGKRWKHFYLLEAFWSSLRLIIGHYSLKFYYTTFLQSLLLSIKT